MHNRIRENIKSGEKHSIIFGKIARWLEDLKLVAFTGSYNDLTGKPSSLPASDVPAWAKSANKPSYTAAEVGAAAANHSHSHYTLNVGSGNTVTGGASLVVGGNNSSSKWQSATVGYGCINNGYNGLVTGYYNTVNGDNDNEDASSMLVAGEFLRADGKRGVVFGYYSTGRDDQTVTGHCNDDSLMAEASKVGTGGTAFVIGNGYNGSHSNAFRVNYNGTVYSKGAYNTTGADYAEYFEWADGNPGMEDRTGLFVTLDGDMIRLAGEGDYILGIISANPSVTGNSDEHWMGQFKKDIFNRYVIEEKAVTVKEIKMEAVLDGNGRQVLDGSGNPVMDIKETEKEVTAKVYVENEEYDKDKGYIHRADRPEWDAVGMLGQLVCYDDGTCQVNGYCKCGQNGTATSATFEEGSFQMPVYRVMERVSDNLIKILVK